MKRIKTSIKLFLGLLISVLLSQPFALAVEVSATVDRHILYLDESLNLVVTAEDKSTNIPTPDLRPLQQDFEILGQSTQTNINIVNSSPTITQSWILEIQPKRLGEVEIPSLMVAGESTEPIQLLVQEFTGNVATEGAEVFVEVDVSNDNPYVQSQVNITTRLFYSIPITSGTLSEPQVPFATMEGAPQEKRYQAKRAGIDYRVVERRYAIFPNQSGIFTIPPVEFNSVIERTHPDTNARSNFRERYSSTPVQLEVRPIPLSYSGTTWLPAQELHLLDSWNGRRPTLTSGAPEAREISIDAVGLRAAQLPLVTFETNNTARIYDGNSADLKTSYTYDAVIARRTDEFAIIPNNVGVVEVPKFTVVWWDVNEDREKITELPAMSVPVDQSIGEQPVVDANGQFSSVNDELSALDFFLSPQNHYWQWVSLALLGMWMLTLLIWYLSRRSHRRMIHAWEVSQAQKMDSERQSLRRVKQVCASGKTTDISSALLDWATLYWPHQPPRNLIDLGRRLKSAQLLTLLEGLDCANYSETGSFTEGRTLWLELSKSVNSRRRTKKKKRFFRLSKTEDRLQDLWPEHGSTAS